LIVLSEREVGGHNKEGSRGKGRRKMRLKNLSRLFVESWDPELERGRGLHGLGGWGEKTFLRTERGLKTMLKPDKGSTTVGGGLAKGSRKKVPRKM